MSGVRELNLTTLFLDIRGSSSVLYRSPQPVLLVFVQEFVALTTFVLDEIVPVGQSRIDTFLGDGFLIFISEPTDHPMVEEGKIGPDLAVAVAVRFRDGFRQLCHSEQITGYGFEQLRLAAGISYGPVLFGQVADQIVTGLGVDVGLAARLVHHAAGDQILVSTKAYRHLSTSHRVGSRQLSFEPKGLDARICYSVLGPPDAPAERVERRFWQRLHSAWDRLRRDT